MRKFYFIKLRYFIIVFLLKLHFILAQNPAQVGQWSDIVPFNIVPVAVVNLPDGRLLTWSSKWPDRFEEIGYGMTFTQIYDPTIGPNGRALSTQLAQTDHDMFCPGINNLADGRILSAGGTSGERTSIYDPATNQWTTAQDMNIPRGYQGNVTLSNGSVFTVGGSWSGGAGNNGGKAAEIWSPETGWINLPNITGERIYTANDLSQEPQQQRLYRVDNHVWLWPAPNGKIFHAGPSEQMNWIDADVPGGAIVPAGRRGTDTYSMKGTTVMFDTGKILKVGGARAYGQDYLSNTPAKDDSYVINLNNVAYGVNPPMTYTGNLQFNRTMHNSTVLPNGQVLVTGGLDRAAVFTDQGARLAAELFDDTKPLGSKWTTVAMMNVPRTYHSVAILMTDGRVFVGGGGLCDSSPGCINHNNAEIYSPPYLFNSNGSIATRPVISAAPNTANYNSTISVTATPGIQEFSLIRFSSATHSTNNEQRRIPVSFVPNGGNYNIAIPDRNLLPPGYYMLFGLNSNGVPSVARTIRIGNALPLTIADPNLIVDLKFNETSGNVAYDSSSYNNNAAIIEKDNNGNPAVLNDFQWTSGLFGGAIEFDGLEHRSNSLMQIPHSNTMATLNNHITVMAWVYRNGSGSTVPGTSRVANVGIFSHNYTSTLFFGFHNTLYKWAFLTNTGPVDLYAGYAPMDRWVHLAATYDGQHAKLYANGELIAWKEHIGTIPFLRDGSPQSYFTSSGFHDRRPASQLPTGSYASGITDEINGKIDELKVYNKILGESEIRTAFERGLQTGNPSVANCNSGTITAEYRIGTTGNWLPANSISTSKGSISVPEGTELYIRGRVANHQYFLTTEQENGPTFNSNGNASYAYRVDTSVYRYPNTPNRNDGFVDSSNRGQYVFTTPQGCSAVIDLDVIVVDTTNGCPNLLENDAPGIVLNKGTSNGLEISRGTPFTTNGSPCALELSNTTTGTPYVRHEITMNLNTLGINAGDRVFFSLDANGSNGIPRVEIVLNNQANSGTLSHTYGPGWSTWSGTMTVPSGISTINIWLFTNFASNNPGTVFYDNLRVIKLSSGNQPPIARASATPTSGTAPLAVAFNGSASTDDSGIVSYSWNFGNGNTASSANPSHTYTTPGNYAATLTVVDGAGLANTTSVPITVNATFNQPPVARVSATPTSGTAPLVVAFNGSASTDDTGITSYNWNFGNGNSATMPNPTHTYTTAGNYTATLTVVDGAGLSNSSSINISVNAPINQAPVARISATPTSGTAPLLVTFNGSASTDDTGIASYNWNFGDGNSVTTTNPTHTYTPAGNYTATLTVVDGAGLSHTSSISITVIVPTNQAPVARVSATPTSGTAPLLVQFNGGGSTDDTGIASYNWNFGDGNSATTVNPTHTFTASGNYTATLTVIDGAGLSHSASVPIAVSTNTNQPPVARVSAGPTTGAAPLLVSFDGSASSDDSGVTAYNWNFGDGNFATIANPSHTYNVAGNYTVTLTVVDEAGLSHSAGTTITVSDLPNGAPVAVITANPTTGIVPFTVIFNGDDSTDDQGIASYFWDFKDGTTSANINPVRTFTVAGTYVVELIVTDDNGLTDNATITIIANENTEYTPPMAMAVANPLSGNAPLEVYFEGRNAADENSTVSYFWNFGDGISAEIANPTHTFLEMGTYAVTLTLTDALGVSDTTLLIIQVNATENQHPIAVATATSPSGIAPLEISFTGANSTDALGIVSYVWDFGDGSTETGITPTHTFAEEGTYLVSLTITNAAGLTDTVTLTVEVFQNVVLDSEIRVVLAPNPAKDKVTLYYNNTDINTQITEIHLFDAGGRRVQSFRPEEIVVGSAFEIPVFTLRNGVYYLSLVFNSGDPVAVRLLVNN